MKKSTVYIIVLIAFILSVSIGMMDYETQSLWHLFTSDGGNIIMLIILTIAFSSVGIVLTVGFNFLWKQFKKTAI